MMINFTLTYDCNYVYYLAYWWIQFHICNPSAPTSQLCFFFSDLPCRDPCVLGVELGSPGWREKKAYSSGAPEPSGAPFGVLLWLLLLLLSCFGVLLWLLLLLLLLLCLRLRLLLAGEADS
jgi:hypothetical protein